jgi:sugar/nucleoside kinase (ribokinase family)
VVEVPATVARGGVVIIVLGSTEPELEFHRRQVATMLERDGDADLTIRFAPATPDGEARVAAVKQADILICIVGTSNGPELPDGSGYAETEVAVARRLGVRVLAYVHDAPAAPAAERDPLHEYSMARARRFKTLLKEHYGVRRFATPDELLAGVVEDLGGVRSDARASGSSVIDQLHWRLQSTTNTIFDTYAISLHNMDAIYRIEHFAPYREEYVDPPKCSPGGGGANIAYALARLGMRTAVAGCTAADAEGAQVHASLKQAGVNTDFLLELDPGSSVRTGRTIILADSGGRPTVFTEAGANSRFAAEVADRGLRQALLQGASRSRIVVVTYFRTAAERRLQQDLLDSLPADTLVAFTPGSLYESPGASQLAPVIGRTNVMFISEEALGRLLGELVPHMDVAAASVPQRAHALIGWRHELGSRDPFMIVVRRPWRGSEPRDGFRYLYLCWGQKGYEGGTGTDGHLSSDDADRIVDGTGTGGALAAGVLYGLLRSRPPDDCANLAYVLALSAAMRYGSRDGVLTRTEVAQRWSHWLRVDAEPSWL